MNSTTKKPHNSTLVEIEALKRNIKETVEALNITEDSFMKPILAKLLKDQIQHLTDLESRII